MAERRKFKMSLPKPVADRISRYAAEGRQLRTVFGPQGCRLVAVAVGRVPAVVLRGDAPDQFAEMRSAVLVEWLRIRRRFQKKHRGRHALPKAS
jgi:hypothetical protein